MRRLLAAVALACLVVGPVLSAGSTARAADPPVPLSNIARPPTVEVVLDISGSMGERDSTGRVKIEGAKAAVLDYIAGAEPTSNFGLLTYPAAQSDCGSGTQRVPLGTLDGASASALVRTLTPGGGTPTGEALLAANANLDAAGASGGIILLVSDGHSTCSEDPCKVAKLLHDKGTNVQVDTVGFRVDADGASQLQCIANAGGGRYIGVDDVTQLDEQLTALSRPAIRVTLDPATQTVRPASGAGDEGLATITARITNDSDIPARALQAILQGTVPVDDPNSFQPAFYQPLNQNLGNLAAHGSTVATWTFRPSLSAVSDLQGDAAKRGRSFAFQVVVHGDNTTRATRVDGSVSVVQVRSKDDAGPLLKNAEGIVILGDSYSAGEGTGVYLPGQDELPNHLCHRSAQTYLLPLLGLDGDYNLACSGAVTEDIDNPKPSRDIPSQIAQLTTFEKTHRVDAAVMTMGGNDIGFADIILTCLVRASCNEQIGVVGHQTPTQQYLFDHFNGLSDRLAFAYEHITDTLNSESARKKRGGALAPLIVLAYPRILPGADRTCLTMATLGQGELDFANELITRLNGMIQATVDEARREGVPVWFVPDTEDSFLPDHTLCDNDRYARGLDEMRALTAPQRLGFLNFLKAVSPPPAQKVEQLAVFAAATWSHKQEVFHPKIEGYAAMSLAIVRWSLSQDGQAAADVPKSMAPKRSKPHLPVDVAHPPIRLTVGAPRTAVLAGATVQVQAPGFAPGTSVSIDLHSAPIALGQTYVDDDGVARVEIALPAGVTGHHDVEITGFDAAGNWTTAHLPLDIGHRTRILTPLRITAAGVLLCLVCACGEFFRRKHGPEEPNSGGSS